MEMQTASPMCRVCRNELVVGVACDGQFENCPHRVQQVGAPRRSHSQIYAEILSVIAQPGEFDAVRGES